jgi:hypothetical protein
LSRRPTKSVLGCPIKGSFGIGKSGLFPQGIIDLEQDGSRFGFERTALRDGLVDANDQSGRAVQGLG